MQIANTPITLTGSIADNQTIRLDHPLQDTIGRVELTIRKLPEPEQKKESLTEFRQRIRSELNAAGYVPPTAQEVMQFLDEERNSWERDR